MHTDSTLTMDVLQALLEKVFPRMGIAVKSESSIEQAGAGAGKHARTVDIITHVTAAQVGSEADPRISIHEVSVGSRWRLGQKGRGPGRRRGSATAAVGRPGNAS